MPRPIQALVHPHALQHNLQTARASAGDAKLWAVVKANAYGHGIERVFEAFRGADGFALLDLQEAQRLRELGWRGPVLLLEGVFEPRDLEVCSRHLIWHAVHCEQQIDMLAAHKTQLPHRVFLKLNAGMNRLGFKPCSFRSAYARLDALSQVDEISMMTHFSDADGAIGIAAQLAVFENSTQGLPGERSVCNSAASLRFGREPRAHLDWVRVGIALYGSSPNFPDNSSVSWNLQPGMSLRSRIIGVQALAAGETVGYGSRFQASEPMLLGIVACGYADGYPRICDTGTPVLVDGVRTRTIGRVSMDMLAVDLGPARAAGKPAGFGSEVVLWGCASAAHGSSILPIDEVAAHAQTVGYELMCAVAPRVAFAVE